MLWSNNAKHDITLYKQRVYIMWIDQLDEHARRAFLLLKAYEEARRASGHGGYTAVKVWNESVVEMPIFKQFMTVVSWLDSQGWKVTREECHWSGYVKYVFFYLAPIIPQPGQMKNKMILEKYVKSSAMIEPACLPRAKLNEIYDRVIRSDLKVVTRKAVIAGLH